MKIIASTIAATLIASASFAGAALAGNGDYYEGVWPDHTIQSAHQIQSDSYGYTGSISRAYGVDQQGGWMSAEASPDRGDYYEGINRPN
ncbi:hypothetical protein [Neorhizobium petrolearium]|uniref:hypothetical protein n=1 Tax=Neorhizobium petrolearium TaxID=515361 RepID=UPI003F7E65AD